MNKRPTKKAMYKAIDAVIRLDYTLSTSEDDEGDNFKVIFDIDIYEELEVESLLVTRDLSVTVTINHNDQ